MNCHCGNELGFDQCCGQYLSGEAKPDTAEALMRSRYTAYATENIDYVLATHDPDTVASVDREGATRWSKDSEWLGLEILSTDKGGPEDDEGKVEFVARYRAGQREVSHHEESAFRRIDGDWYYVDGDIVKPKPLVRSGPKIGRNEPCPCGSGIKYKKCHGR